MMTMTMTMTCLYLLSKSNSNIPEGVVVTYFKGIQVWRSMCCPPKGTTVDWPWPCKVLPISMASCGTWGVFSLLKHVNSFHRHAPRLLLRESDLGPSPTIINTEGLLPIPYSLYFPSLSIFLFILAVVNREEDEDLEFWVGKSKKKNKTKKNKQTNIIHAIFLFFLFSCSMYYDIS